jgi:hypothetical protein
VRYVEGEDLRALDPDGIALTNLNTADDVARAEAIVADYGLRPDPPCA